MTAESRLERELTEAKNGLLARCGGEYILEQAFELRFRTEIERGGIEGEDAQLSDRLVMAGIGPAQRGQIFPAYCGLLEATAPPHPVQKNAISYAQVNRQGRTASPPAQRTSNAPPDIH